MRRKSVIITLMVMVVSLLFAGWTTSANAASNTGGLNLGGLNGLLQPHQASVPKPHPTNTRPSVINNDPTQLPVLWVHGIINMLGGCAGINADKQPATLRTMLGLAGYTGPLLGVAYYCGDSGSFVIRDCGGTYGSQYGNNVPIERLGFDLAWCIYNNYSQWGQYIDLAGHSMGGLIIDEALTKSGTAATYNGQPYPPALLVRDTITYSTPYLGTNKAPNTAVWCGTTVQCQELTPGSAFVNALQQRSLPSSVVYTTVGGGPADNVDDFTSSSSVNAQYKVNYYAKTPVNYNHNTYFMDSSTAQDEPFTLTVTATGMTYAYVSWHATYYGALFLKN